MVQWIKRGTWLLAWSCWPWLGWGMYRELPRDPGPPLYTFSEADNALFGTTGDGTAVITFEMNDRGEPWTIRRWSTENGRLEQEFAGPTFTDELKFEVSPKCHFLVTKKLAPLDRDSRWLRSLDLRTGTWRDLPPVARGEVTFHSERPWAATYLFAQGNEKGEVHVIHLETGVELFSWLGREDRVLARAPVFAGDALAIQTGLPYHPQRTEDEDVKGSTLQIWSMLKPAAPARIIEGVRIGHDPAASNTGRIAWRDETPDSVRVFDASHRKTVLSYPPHQDVLLKDVLGHWPGPQISKDGRAVYAPFQKAILDVDSGREVWAIRDDGYLSHWDGGDFIEIMENWPLPVDGGFSWKTYAVRDAYSGALVNRCWNPSAFLNASKQIRFAIDGGTCSVHSLPLVVNWPLFALCQTILALPLVLLWAILRWRRKRRLPPASVTP
jgi:hypothetical protein